MIVFTPAVLSMLAVATLATSFVSGVLGMAGGMILMGVLLALLPLPAAMLLHGVIQLAANGSRALLLRRDICWPVFGGYAAGALTALALFALVHAVVDKSMALVAMGLTPFAAMALPRRLHLSVTRRLHPLACGLMCQSLSLTAGVAGPLLDTFFVRANMSRHAVVATKAMTQCLSHVLKVVYFGSVMAAGGGVPAWIAAAAVLLAFAGTSASRRALECISDAAFRAWTRWTVLALGAIYLVTGMRAWL
jgi:uncharacterized membrane protein YfcA